MKHELQKDNYNIIHTVESKKFNNSCIQIVFQNEYSEEKITDYNFLMNLMSYCSNDFPSHRELCIELERLYCTEINFYNMRIGNTLLSIFCIDFLNPKFCYASFLDDVINSFFSIIYNPIFKNEKFEKNFEIIKNKMKFDIETEMENPNHKAIMKSHYYFDKSLHTSHSSLGTIERLNTIRKEDLENLHKRIIIESKPDIFVVGDLNMNYVKEKILFRYKNSNFIKLSNRHYIKRNMSDKKNVDIEEKGEYDQDIFVAVYNLRELNDFEYNYTMNVFNNIFANGGLTSKLYRYLREKNSLCYNVRTIYQKYDSVLSLIVGFDSQNKDKCIKIIEQALDEMTNGEFNDEDIENAKKNIITSIELGKDSISSVLNNYLFNVIDDGDLFDEKKEKYSTITKEQVVNVAKKIDPKVYYILKGEKDGKDSDK